MSQAKRKLTRSELQTLLDRYVRLLRQYRSEFQKMKAVDVVDFMPAEAEQAQEPEFNPDTYHRTPGPHYVCGEYMGWW